MSRPDPRTIGFLGGCSLYHTKRFTDSTSTFSTGHNTFCPRVPKLSPQLCYWDSNSRSFRVHYCHNVSLSATRGAWTITYSSCDHSSSPSDTDNNSICTFSHSFKGIAQGRLNDTLSSRWICTISPHYNPSKALVLSHQVLARMCCLFFIICDGWTTAVVCKSILSFPLVSCGW